MNPLRLLKLLVQTLQGGADPKHIAAGFALGAAMGLTPKGNLFAVIFLLLFIFFRVDKGMALVSAALFTPIGFMIDGLANAVGTLLLVDMGFLKPLWTLLYDLPVVPWTKFNNTVVLGNLVIGLALFFPLYFGFIKVVIHYQQNYQAKVMKTPLMKWLMGLKIVSWYNWLTSD